MTINEHTKIAALIKADKRSISALAGVAKPLEKLHNPLLRKVLAGRTNLAQAARIAGCSVAQLAEALAPLGFEYVAAPAKEQEGVVEEKGLSHPPEGPVQVLDVRADIAAGKDPLKGIMKTLRSLPDGHVLQLINTFEPSPLIRLLRDKGYDHYVLVKAPEEVHTWFKKRASALAAEDLPDGPPESVGEDVFEKRLAAFGSQVRRLDVSTLEMPLPMVTILENLENLPQGHALLVHHRRIPVFLFPELGKRAFGWLLLKQSATDIHLLLFHKT